MSPDRKYQVILGPHVSEKTTRLGDQDKKQITFKVARTATKAEIKISVEEIFKVKVDSVQVVNVKPKIKWFKRVQGFIFTQITKIFKTETIIINFFCNKYCFNYR